jgi:predicted permease
LDALFTLFLNNLLPILLIAGAGFLVGKMMKIDPRSLSRVVFYILSPCLVFTLLVDSQLSNGDMLRMLVFSTAQLILIGALTLLIGRILKTERRLLAAMLITTMTLNAGNYGLSLNLFAFGETAVSYASLFFIAMILFTYTGGVAIASLGSSTLKQTFVELLKVPMIYAVLLALIFKYLGWQLPLPLDRSVRLLSDATIPTMVLLLGLQLQHNQRTDHTRELIWASGIRLLSSPIFAILTATLFGLQGIARKAGIVEASMPTAVVSTVLATEYDADPAFVTTMVFITTLLSPLTLTPLLAYLGA